MKKTVLDNGVKILYKFREGSHTSFCIALEAGANSESKSEIGVAHALEHMIFKGTKNINEDEINNKLDELFGFNNAMTNFPYVLYYGTTSNEDFEEGFSLYSDMILNPLLDEDGFCEEMSVIKQESNEWIEDLDQYCEDLLLYNGFKKERINEIIIGKEKNINNITINDLREFYKNNYVPNNITISIVTSMNYEDIERIISELFSNISGSIDRLKEITNRQINSGKFIKEVTGNNGCKINVGFDISFLSTREITALKLINLWLGEGVSSILFDDIRTKHGLAYEVYSNVKAEKGIKIFKIGVSTSKDSLDKTLRIIEDCITKARNIDKYLDDREIEKLYKRFKLKTSLDLERSIVLASRMAIYELMYKDSNLVFDELNMTNTYNINELKEIINKVFNNEVIQILI